MSKNKKIFTMIFVSLLFVGIIALILSSIYSENGLDAFQKSTIEFNETLKDGSSEIVTDFTFKYNNVKTETKTIMAELNKDSKITINDYSATSECRLLVYDGKKQLWNKVIENDMVFNNIVQKQGEYKIVLEMDTGEGEGTVIIR